MDTRPFTQAVTPPAAHTPSYSKPVPGEIDGVVQAHSDDKKAFPEKSSPDAYTKWRFEVVLAVDDPTVADSGGKHAGPPPTIFQQGEAVAGQPWRCAACYAQRFKTMCFGMNDPLFGGGDQAALLAQPCRHCGKARGEGGWRAQKRPSK